MASGFFSFVVALAGCLALSCGALLACPATEAVGARDDGFELHMLTDPRAVCLDGSLGGFYVRPGRGDGTAPIGIRIHEIGRVLDVLSWVFVCCLAPCQAPDRELKETTFPVFFFLLLLLLLLLPLSASHPIILQTPRTSWWRTKEVAGVSRTMTAWLARTRTLAPARAGRRVGALAWTAAATACSPTTAP
jgi:hypothetical protein